MLIICNNNLTRHLNRDVALFMINIDKTLYIYAMLKQQFSFLRKKSLSKKFKSFASVASLTTKRK